MVNGSVHYPCGPLTRLYEYIVNNLGVPASAFIINIGMNVFNSILSFHKVDFNTSHLQELSFILEGTHMVKN